jgi:hypothetical protein
LPQSVLVTHCTHALSRQCAAVVGQFTSVMHSTHPGGFPGATQRTGPASGVPPPLELLLPASEAPPLELLLLLPASEAPPLELLLLLPASEAPPLLELLLPEPLLLPELLPEPLPLLLPAVESGPASGEPVAAVSPLHCQRASEKVAASGPKTEIQWMVCRALMDTPRGVKAKVCNKRRLERPRGAT